ncbi:hypothetical protein TPENAI_10416 [Tenacibaculum litopenaei]
MLSISFFICNCNTSEVASTTEEYHNFQNLGVKESDFLKLDILRSKGNTLNDKKDFALRLNLYKAYYKKEGEKEVFFAPVRMFGDYPRDYLFVKINNVVTERFFTYIGKYKKEIHIHDLKGTLIDIIKINSKGIGSSVLNKSTASKNELCPKTVYIKCSSGQHSFENEETVHSCSYWDNADKGNPPSMFVQFSSCETPIPGGGGSVGPGGSDSGGNSVTVPGGGSGGGLPITDMCLMRTDCDYCPKLKRTVTKKECEDIIINYLSGKSKCVYDKLTRSSRNFKDMIKKFDGQFPVSHLKFTINNSIGLNTYGITIPPVDYITEIQINENRLSNLSDLGVAATLAHELIHAEIFRKLLSAAQRGDLNTAIMSQQEAENYVNSLKDNFPGLYNYYVERWNPMWNHNMMASHYRTTIADILQSFDNNRLSRSKYEAIAWAGLGEIENNQSTIAWQNLISSEQQAITNILNKHFF